MKTKKQIDNEIGKFYVKHLAYHVNKFNLFPSLTRKNNEKRRSNRNS